MRYQSQRSLMMDASSAISLFSWQERMKSLSSESCACFRLIVFSSSAIRSGMLPRIFSQWRRMLCLVSRSYSSQFAFRSGRGMPSRLLKRKNRSISDGAPIPVILLTFYYTFKSSSILSGLMQNQRIIKKSYFILKCA